MIETFRVLALSTSHVTKEVGDTLDQVLGEGDRDNSGWAYWIVGSPWPYGWWIWAWLEAIDDLPECLRQCLAFAREQGCRYVLFDSDVEPIDQLPTFEW